MADVLLFEKRGHIAVLTLNDPETRNALTGEDMFGGIERAVDTINADLNIRAVILTGAGTAFCSGGNVRDMRDKKGMFGGTGTELASNYRNGIQRIPRAIYRLEAPIIAAVNGPAIGAGFDLACMCDLRVASETAVFAESFIKVGIVAGDGGSWFLPRVIGWTRAAEMALTGDSIDAKTALEYGLVSRVVPAAELMTAATALAERIAANPPQVTRWTKRLLRDSSIMSLDGALEQAATYQSLAHGTRDHEEALAAMFEKRKPNFEGR